MRSRREGDEVCEQGGEATGREETGRREGHEGNVGIIKD
jgi:hypothetical protein